MNIGYRKCLARKKNCFKKNVLVRKVVAYHNCKGTYVSPRLRAIVLMCTTKIQNEIHMVSMADAAGDSLGLPLLAIPFKGEQFDSPLKHSYFLQGKCSIWFYSDPSYLETHPALLFSGSAGHRKTKLQLRWRRQSSIAFCSSGFSL